MYQLKLTPETESGRSELTGEVCWYPLKINENILMSINITTRYTYNLLKDGWLRRERMTVSSPIDGTHECFLYLGTIGDPRIVPMFQEWPLMVKNGSIYYFFSDNEFGSIHKKINIMKNKSEIGEVGNRTKQKACLDFFKECLSPDWSSSLKHIKPKRVGRDLNDYAFHTNEIGLHPLLHLVQLIPDNMWDKDYYKKMLVHILKNGFLVSWVYDIEGSNKRDYILKKCKSISGWEITTIPQFEDVLKDIVKQLVDKRELFGILYLASQSASESSVVRALFNNLFRLVPKEQKKEVGCPRFQPKLIVYEIELHFIQVAILYANIESMRYDLMRIFDEIDFYELGDHRYRFVCRVELPIQDYSLLPYRVGEIYDAVRTLARRNNLSEPTQDVWVKRFGVQFITPPQFEDDVLLAFSRNWFFRRKPKALDELDEENRRKIMSADIICDYSIYQDGEFVFPFKYFRDVQNSYVVLNRLLLKNHNFTQFGEMNPPKE